MLQRAAYMLMMSHWLCMLMRQKITRIIYIELAEQLEQVLLELW
jgi:hypothetical protein